MLLPISSVLDEAGSQLGGFLPRLGGALVLLVVGIILVRLVARILGKVLETLGLDEMAERWGVHDALERAGLGRSISHTIVVAIRFGLTLVVIFAALSLLGLQFLSESLNEAVLFLPSLLVAAALLLAGVVLGGFAREHGDRLGEQMNLPIPLGALAQVVVVSIFAITAAAQIAVSSAILLVLVAIVLAGAVACIAIAFGLGGREIAGALNAGRLLEGSLELGQRVEVAGLSGEIIAFDPVATVLKNNRGDLVRVPNNLLVTEPVTIKAEVGGSGGDPGSPGSPPATPSAPAA